MMTAVLLALYSVFKSLPSPPLAVHPGDACTHTYEAQYTPTRQDRIGPQLSSPLY